MGRGERVQQILIADGHLLFRSGLRSFVNAESDLRVLDEASTLGETILKVRTEAPDVVVMDVALLFKAQDSELAEIRSWEVMTSMLFLAHVDTPENLAMVSTAGSPSFLLKNTAPAQLVGAIRQACWRDEQAGDGLSKTGADLRALAKSNLGQARGPVLTLREQEVLKFLAEGHTVRETAMELTLSAKTIEAHKLNLMRKLDIHSRSTLIQYAVSMGIVEPAVA